MALDRNLAALLTEDVSYQQKTGTDQYGQDTWGTPVTLKCYPAYGARQIQRRDGTVYVSAQSLYFDGSNATVQAFKLGDRFTSIGVAGGETMEAAEIQQSLSPGPGFGQPMSDWLVEVAL